MGRKPMDYESKRNRMVDKQIIARGVNDPSVIDTFRKVPRHKFIPAGTESRAYDDSPLPIGEGQTISQPYIAALMTEVLELKGSEKTLEIGLGSGYQTAVLSRLSSEVFSVERIPSLAVRAETTLSTLGYKNVHIHIGDGSLGWEEHAPYEAIIVTASCPAEPSTLLKQLSQGGRLVAPIGGAFSQILTVYKKDGSKIIRKEIIPCVFVPLIGREAWNG